MGNRNKPVHVTKPRVTISVTVVAQSQTPSADVPPAKCKGGNEGAGEREHHATQRPPQEPSIRE